MAASPSSRPTRRCGGPTGHAHWAKCTPACGTPLAAKLGKNVDAILTQITSLRKGKPTLIRITNFYNDDINDPTADPGPG